jgi:hypothetical protein
MPESFGRAAYELAPWVSNLTIDDAVKLLVQQAYGTTPPGGGGSGSGGVVLGGVQENDSLAIVTAPNSTVIPPGSLGFSFMPLSGFIGTINGVAWLDVATTSIPGGNFSKVPQPGNTVRAYTIACTAGSYVIAVTTKP